MPQKNGWATGPEYIDNSSRCPFCGSDEIEGGVDTCYEGDIVVCRGCVCAACGKTWGEQFALYGWVDGDGNLHEDARQLNKLQELESLQKSMEAAVQEIALIDANSNSEPDVMARALDEAVGIAQGVLAKLAKVRGVVS